MNCSEVMELMQRQLDHDLNESEQSLLTEHLNSCAACTEMFERLKMLNDGLEQLPKVMPKISLVDSIMPQLDEIDRLNAIQDQVNAGKQTDDQAPGLELMPLSMKEHTTAQVAQDSDQPLVRNRRWLERIHWRTTSAVIAAGLVFGLFLVNYEPNAQESADFPELTVQDEKAASTSTANKIDEPEQTSTLDSNSKTDQAASPQTANVNDTDTESVAEEAAPTSSNEEAGNRNEGTSPDHSASKDERAIDDQAGSLADVSDSTGATGAESSSTDASDEKMMTQTPAAKDDRQANQVQEIDALDLSSSPTSDETGNSEGISGMRSTHSLSNPLQTISPDQNYDVVWDNGLLTVSKKDGENSSLLQSLTWKTEPGELRWSEDSKQLTIVSSNTTGQVVEVTYEITDKGLKQVKVTKNTQSVSNSSARSAAKDSDTRVNSDVSSDEGTAEFPESPESSAP